MKKNPSVAKPVYPPLLINILHEEQDRNGYISEEALKRLSVKHDIPIAKLYGVVKFYAMFRTEPQGKNVVEICGSPSCVLNDGTRLEKFLEEKIGIRIGETSKDGKFSLYKTSCIGCCDEAPALLLNGKPHTKLTVERVAALIEKLRE